MLSAMGDIVIPPVYIPSEAYASHDWDTGRRDTHTTTSHMTSQPYTISPIASCLWASPRPPWPPSRLPAYVALPHGQGIRGGGAHPPRYGSPGSACPPPPTQPV